MNYEETYVYTGESRRSCSYGGSDGSLRIIHRCQLSISSIQHRSSKQHRGIQQCSRFSICILICNGDFKLQRNGSSCFYERN